jgi:hypothetical protein
MWKQRLHKCFHRVVGGSLALVGILNELKAVDLTPLLHDHTALALSLMGVAVAALEFLPLLGSWLDGDTCEDKKDAQ